MPPANGVSHGVSRRRKAGSIHAFAGRIASQDDRDVCLPGSIHSGGDERRSGRLPAQGHFPAEKRRSAAVLNPNSGIPAGDKMGDALNGQQRSVEKTGCFAITGSNGLIVNKHFGDTGSEQRKTIKTCRRWMDGSRPAR